MLTVAIELDSGVVAMLGCITEPGTDGAAHSKIEWQHENGRSRTTSQLCRPVTGAVVDHKNVGTEHRARVSNDAGNRALLVQRGDYDEKVADDRRPQSSREMARQYMARPASAGRSHCGSSIWPAVKRVAMRGAIAESPTLRLDCTDFRRERTQPE